MNTDFLAWQAAIVNEYKRPDQFVTHDLAGPPRPEVNEENRSFHGYHGRQPYHGTQDRFDGLGSSIGRRLYAVAEAHQLFVTETNAETIGWDSSEQFPPYDGQLRLGGYTHISSGANMVEYWHWHSIHNGQETIRERRSGARSEPGRAYDEVSRTAHELRRDGPEIVDLRRNNKVAILYSDDSHYGIEFHEVQQGSVTIARSCSRCITLCYTAST